MNAIRSLFWNHEEARLRAGWRLLVAFIVYAILIFLVVRLSQRIFAGRLADADLEMLTTAIHSLLVLVIFLWLVGSHLLDRRPFAEYGFHLNREWWLNMVFGLALGAFLMAGIFVVERLLGWLNTTDRFAVTSTNPSFAMAILVGMIAIPLAAINEEVTWRGYILRNLAEGLNWKMIGPRLALFIAVVITSVWFGWSHADNPNATTFSTLNAVLGTFLVLASGYALTGELALPIGFHTAWNFAQLYVFGFPVSGLTVGAAFIAMEQSGPEAWTGGAYGPEGGLLGTLAFFLGFLAIVAWIRVRRGGVRLHASLAEMPSRRSNAMHR